jgi:hypothetical protein
MGHVGKLSQTCCIALICKLVQASERQDMMKMIVEGCPTPTVSNSLAMCRSCELAYYPTAKA